MNPHRNALATSPDVVEHEGVTVIRDDLFPGGTKARFPGFLFEATDEVVYARGMSRLFVENGEAVAAIG